MWLLTGFMGAAYYLVPEESRIEIWSERARLDPARAVARDRASPTIVGYLFGITEGRKFLEMPLPLKFGVVVVMLMFLYNLAHDDPPAPAASRRPRACWSAGSRLRRCCSCPGLIPFDNYTLDRFYRWWVVHLWVEGVWELIMGALLAFLLIRLSGADREVHGEVALRDRGAHVPVGHPRHRAPLLLDRHAALLAVGGRLLLRARAARVPRHGDLRVHDRSRRSGLAHPNALALHWTLGSAIFSALGAGILGFAHTWPQVNQWTHGTHVTTMHGHMAFFGAYAMIVLAMISVRASGAHRSAPSAERQTRLGLWAFWLMVGGMFGMTMALAAAGIPQTYLERILGFGYLETQQQDPGALPDVARRPAVIFALRAPAPISWDFVPRRARPAPSRLPPASAT